MKLSMSLVKRKRERKEGDIGNNMADERLLRGSATRLCGASAGTFGIGSYVANHI